MEQINKTQPDAAKVFDTIAAILSRRDGRRVKVVAVRSTAQQQAEMQRKAG